MGSPEQLKSQIASDIIILALQTQAQALLAADMLKSFESIKEIQTIDSTLHIYVDRTGNRDVMLPSVMKLLHQHDIHISMVQFSRPTLDDVFLKLTGKTLRDSGN